MARPPALPTDKKVEIVLDILSGRTTAAQAARSVGVSGQAISNWKNKFIAAGSDGLETGTDQHARREQQLLEEISELKSALGDSYLQLRTMRATLRARATFNRPPSSRPYGAIPKAS
ncbi:transposase [Streptomyces sp. NPDC057623]|uniref:transposase n=1 Tax=Streptomyces sp. NPDC057623 TaxID=3346187 RepID=UPI003685FFD8